jgi:Fe2+ or Zn2+ uptake regulation protein
MPIGVGPTATITQPIPSTTPVTPTPSATPLATPSPALEIAHTLGESQADQLPQGEQATSRRRRTTFSAEKRLGRVKDYFYSHNGAEFTVRDILENVYPGESGYDIPPSYTTTYRDLEVLARQGVVVKEKKLDPRNKRYKNFYRLSKIESTLADIEERSPGEDKSVETPPAPTTNMPENGFVVFPFFRQAGGSVPLAVVASDPDMSNTGGIDFRGLGMLVKKGIKLQEQQIYDEDFKKLEDEIEQNIKIGTLPDSMILKKWYGLAQLCRNTQTALSRVRKCIADLLKQQEKLAIATDPVEKNLLILLASVCVVNNSP